MKEDLVLCSTGALIGLPNNRDYTLLRPFSEKLTCDGYEFMMYSSWYEKQKEIIRNLKSYSLRFPVMHCEKHIGEAISIGGEDNLQKAKDLFSVNCEIANEIGAEKMVIHLWDGIPSDQKFSNNLLFYPVLERIAEEHRITLLVENVVCNKEDPMKHWCELAKEYPSVRFVYDTKMAAFHNQEKLFYQKEYEWLMEEQKVLHFHINDYAGGYMDFSNMRVMPIGLGRVDFESFFSYLRQTGYHGTYTVEATAFHKDMPMDFAMLNQNFQKIREFIKPRQ